MSNNSPGDEIIFYCVYICHKYRGGIRSGFRDQVCKIFVDTPERIAGKQSFRSYRSVSFVYAILIAACVGDYLVSGTYKTTKVSSIEDTILESFNKDVHSAECRVVSCKELVYCGRRTFSSLP